MAISLDAPIVDPTGTLPRVYRDDPSLTAGTLVLFDFNHSRGFSPGDLDAVPANGATIPNIARSIAAGLTGGTEAEMDLSFVNTAASSKIVMERTAKGMLHGIVSKVSMNTSNYAGLLLPTALKQYLLDHPTHSYFMSLWGAKTRLSSSTAVAQMNVGGNSSASNNFLTQIQDIADNKPLVTHRMGSQFTPGVSTLGMAYQSIWVDAWTGTIPANAAAFAAFLMWGRGPGYTALSNVFGSFAGGRGMLVDLTAAGMTGAQINAIEYARYVADVATAGGKYYGDSWSDPATTLP